MAHRNLLAFRCRHNEGGTWDSICLRCYRTVFSVQNTTYLPLLQSTHTGDPMDLHAWMSVASNLGGIYLSIPSQTPHRNTRRCQVSSFETSSSWRAVAPRRLAPPAPQHRPHWMPDGGRL